MLCGVVAQVESEAAASLRMRHALAQRNTLIKPHTGARTGAAQRHVPRVGFVHFTHAASSSMQHDAFTNTTRAVLVPLSRPPPTLLTVCFQHEGQTFCPDCTSLPLDSCRETNLQRISPRLLLHMC